MLRLLCFDAVSGISSKVIFVARFCLGRACACCGIWDLVVDRKRNIADLTVQLGEGGTASVFFSIPVFHGAGLD